MARAPRVDLAGASGGTAATPTREAKSGPVYDTQKGFEDSLAPPDAVGGGPASATDSDVGEPRWRRNPGSYDDGSRPKHRQSVQQNNEHILPPDTLK